MFYTLIAFDFIMFLYIYIGTQWLGWSLEQTLATKTGFILLIAGAVNLAIVGSKKPRRPGKIVMVIGITLLLLSYAASLQVRTTASILIEEGKTLQSGDLVIKLNKVTALDDPGVIRNDVHAKIDVFKKFDPSFENESRTINIMPRSYSDGNYWRIVRFGFAPVLTLSDANNKTVPQDEPVLITTENWTDDDESIATQAGLVRTPPPRMMLGVGAFPPEMETMLTPGSGSKDRLFVRLSGAKVNGKTVSLDGDDYWRYLTLGRLENPTLSVSLIANKELAKTSKLQIGQSLKFNNEEINFKKLKYWVELEQRRDPFIPVIIGSLLITYLGVGITAIQLLAKVVKNVFKNTI